MQRIILCIYIESIKHCRLSLWS